MITAQADILPLLACTSCGGELVLTSEGDVLTCVTCGVKISVRDGRFFFSEPPEDVPESFQGNTYELWSNWRKANYYFFKETLPTDSSLKILDIGAGPTQFRDLFEKYSTFVGLDFSPYEQVQVVADLTQRLPITDGVFDVVILSNVLEHTPDMSALLTEVRRVLGPGGVCLTTTPFLMRIHQAPYDYNRSTHYQLERTFRLAGFVDVDVTPLGKPANVFYTMHRHFFDALLSTLRKRKGISRVPLLLVAHFLYRIGRLWFKLAESFYTLATPSERYTEGYGTVAR